MREIPIRENESYIRLGQLLKKAGMVTSGVEAKEVIQDGQVSVDGETDTRRGRKLYGGEEITFAGETVRVISPADSSEQSDDHTIH